MLPGNTVCLPASLEPNMLTCDGLWHRVMQLDYLQPVVGNVVDCVQPVVDDAT